MKGFVHSVYEYCRPEWEGTKMLVFILLSTLFPTGWWWSNDKTTIKCLIACKSNIRTQRSRVLSENINHLATQWILHHFWNPCIVSRVHKSLAPISSPRKMNPLTILRSYVFKVNFIIGLLSRPMSSRRWYTSRSTHHPLYHPYTCWWKSQIMKLLVMQFFSI
jgi:hypothetical protein